MNPVRLMLTAALATCPVLCAAAQLLVLNKNDATLSFVDPASGRTSATIATGDGPDGMAWVR